MSSDWPKVKLVDYCDKIGSGATPRGGSKVYLDSGEVSLVRSQNVYNHGFDYDGLVYIDDEAAEKLSNVELKENDVLINITGDSVARVCVVPDDVLPARVNQHVSILRPKNDSLDPRFLRYSLVNYENQYKLLAIASAGGTRKAITKGHLEDFEISLPDLDYQKKVSEILSTFDQKIHLNQQTNETLEAMAQAIFKSWFVDFDPVRAKIEATSAGRDPNRAAMAAISAATKVSADGAVLWDETEAALDQKLARMSEAQQQQLSRTAQLFPDELVGSEIGEVPKGWEYDQLGNFITVKRGGSPRPIKDFVVEEGLHWTKISDATSENSPFIMTTKEFIKEEGLKKTVLLEKGSLILSNSATPGLPKFLNINACIHDGWLYFPETEHFTDHYLYHLFVEIRKALVAKGSGTVFTNLKTSILRNYDVVVPNEELVMKFTNNTQSIFAALLKNREETDTITKLRDTLLPKLISGEVGV
jgi:type I restriction enzyme S subunit